MKKMQTAFFCGILLLAAALTATMTMSEALAAENAQKLHGVWRVDVEASLALAAQQGGFNAEEERRFREKAATAQISIDVPGKLFSIGAVGKTPQSVPIDEFVENKDGSVLVRGRQLNDTYIFLPGGNIRIKNDFLVLKKVK